MSDDKPFAEAIRNGCGKLRVGSMVVAAEYGDMAEATARRIDSDHLADCTARERKAVESAANSAKLRVVFEDDMVRFGLKMKHGSEVVCKDQSVSMSLMETAAVPEMLPVVVYGLDEMKRKAAAQALREAAKAYDSEPQTMTHYDCIAEALRARADAIEKGER